MTPAGGAGAVPAGGGSSLPLPGRLGQDTPGRHHDRSAGAISLDWDSKARVMPASDAGEAGPPASRKNALRCAPSFEPSGRARRTSPRKSRGSRLSGGVRSLPQVPWWNAERRARRKARAARKRGGYGTRLSAFRFPFFFVAWVERSETRDSLSGGNASPDFACAQSGLRPVIVTPPVPPPAASDEDHAWPSFVCLVVGMARAPRRVARTGLL